MADDVTAERFMLGIPDPIAGPTGTMTVPGLGTHLPPKCPIESERFLLQSIRVNEKGDTLYECLSCGYQVIQRAPTAFQSTVYEKPSWWTEPWRSPDGGSTIPTAVEEIRRTSVAADEPEIKREPMTVMNDTLGDSNKKYVSVSEAARTLCISEAAVRYRIKRGELQAYKIAGKRGFCIPADALGVKKGG